MKIVAFIALVVSLSFSSVSAHAQTKETTPTSSSLVVAILDLNSIRRESLVVKNINEQIAVFRNEFRKSIKTEETALKAASKELGNKRNILSREEFAKKRR